MANDEPTAAAEAPKGDPLSQAELTSEFDDATQIAAKHLREARSEGLKTFPNWPRVYTLLSSAIAQLEYARELR